MAPETPKGVSSRLLSMKFMQRAAASAASTPGSDSDAPSSKKRKLGSRGDDYDLNINSESIQAAIDERDAKRQAALQQHTSSDTHWVLDSNIAKKSGKAEKKPMRVLYVGYGDFDSSGEDQDEARPGRTSTKNYKKTDTTKESHENEGESENENGNPASEAKKRKRDSTASSPRSRSLSRSNSKQTPEAEKAKQFRDQRKKKDVNINRITSISNPGAGSSNNSPMTCFTCQQKGHKASDCPQKNSKRTKGKR